METFSTFGGSTKGSGWVIRFLGGVLQERQMENHHFDQVRPNGCGSKPCTPEHQNRWLPACSSTPKWDRHRFCNPLPNGYGSKLCHQGTAGFGPCFPLTRVPFGVPIVDPRPNEGKPWLPFGFIPKPSPARPRKRCREASPGPGPVELRHGLRLDLARPKKWRPCLYGLCKSKRVANTSHQC